MEEEESSKEGTIGKERKDWGEICHVGPESITMEDETKAGILERDEMAGAANGWEALFCFDLCSYHIFVISIVIGSFSFSFFLPLF